MITALSEFKTITGYDLEQFLNDYISFVQNDYNSIVDYYGGADLDAEAFDNLKKLTAEIPKIEPLWTIYRERFKTIEFWELLDAFNDIFVKLESCKKMGKWMRSSRTTQYNEYVQVPRILAQGETFELVSKELGSTDYENDWTIIAIENLVNEERYTPDGGLLFNITLRNQNNFTINNIVDYMQGDNVYGKDIDVVYEFENNDLKTVIFKEALKQTLNTILSTIKGSIPEFPEDGIEDGAIGTNVNAIQYPGIFRNLLNLFRKDGRWIEVNLLDLYRDQDSVFMKLEVQAILKDTFITNVNV